MFKRSQTTLPLQASTDSRIIEHFEQMRTLISSFLQQKSTSNRQPFYDYIASEVDKMSPEEYENFKVLVFNAIQNDKSTPRRQALPKRSTTITTESQRFGILPPAAQPSTSSQTSAATGSSYSVHYTPSPIGFGNPPSVNLQVADEGSRHLIIYPTCHHRLSTNNSSHSNNNNNCSSLCQHCLNISSHLSYQSVLGGWVSIVSFQGHQIFQKQLFSYMLLFTIPLPYTKKKSVQILTHTQKK